MHNTDESKYPRPPSPFEGSPEDHATWKPNKDWLVEQRLKRLEDYIFGDGDGK